METSDDFRRESVVFAREGIHRGVLDRVLACRADRFEMKRRRKERENARLDKRRIDIATITNHRDARGFIIIIYIYVYVFSTNQFSPFVPPSSNSPALSVAKREREWGTEGKKRGERSRVQQRPSGYNEKYTEHTQAENETGAPQLRRAAKKTENEVASLSLL